MTLRHLAVALVATCLLALAPRALVAQDFRVIAHPSISGDGLDAPTLARVFLKQVAKLPDGKGVTPVDQKAASAVRTAFSARILGKRPAAVEQYWQQQIFSGGSTPPTVKDSDDAVIAYVKSTPGAIGYIGAGAGAPDGVKVVTVK